MKLACERSALVALGGALVPTPFVSALVAMFDRRPPLWPCRAPPASIAVSISPRNHQSLIRSLVILLPCPPSTSFMSTLCLLLTALRTSRVPPTSSGVGTLGCAVAVPRAGPPSPSPNIVAPGAIPTTDQICRSGKYHTLVLLRIHVADRVLRTPSIPNPCIHRCWLMAQPRMRGALSHRITEIHGLAISMYVCTTHIVEPMGELTLSDETSAPILGAYPCETQVDRHNQRRAVSTSFKQPSSPANEPVVYRAMPGAIGSIEPDMSSLPSASCCLTELKMHKELTPFIHSPTERLHLRPT